MSDDISLLVVVFFFAVQQHIVAVVSARYFWSALDFNGTIAVRLFILYHGKYIKDIGSCRQRTASAFECVLRGATEVGGGRQDGGFKRRERRR